MTAIHIALVVPSHTCTRRVHLASAHVQGEIAALANTLAGHNALTP
jgi:hypothetical protein